jgi:circadian clock protein KaiC
VYLSTVSEPLEKILRYGQSLAFFDAETIGTRVFFDDLGRTLNDGGLAEVLAHLRELITERRSPSAGQA